MSRTEAAEGPSAGCFDGISIGAIVFRQPSGTCCGSQSGRWSALPQEPVPAVASPISPRVWWPYQYGEPHLETTAAFPDRWTVRRLTKGGRSLRHSERQQQTLDETRPHRLSKVNRRKDPYPRWWMDTRPLLSRASHQGALCTRWNILRQMHLNAIRLEGKLGSEELFRSRGSRVGVLVMAGWQCCDHWQHWDKWTPADHEIAHDSLYSQITRLRSHPSVLVWLNGSDEAPLPAVEEDFLAVLKERDWPAAVLSTGCGAYFPSIRSQRCENVRALRLCSSRVLVSR